MQLLLIAAALLQLSACTNTPISCSSNDTTTPLYVLTLLPFSVGLGLLTGAHIARDEVNGRTDLLPGYRIELIVQDRENCSAPELGIGMSSLLRVAVNAPCRPVLAAIGLGCSSRTVLFSSVAGHAGFDMLQFSMANSPIFDSQIQRFPHLWRFLGSASVYSDAVVAIMDQYRWERIGIVYNIENNFYSDIASNLEQKIKAVNKTVEFDIGIRGQAQIYYDQVINNIKELDVTIIVVLLNDIQDVKLLRAAQTFGVVYPQFTWIYLETLPDNLFEIPSTFNKPDLFAAIHGHIFLHTQPKLRNDSVLISKRSYKSYLDRYVVEFETVKALYSEYKFSSFIDWGGFMYDQVWALALAVNNSLLELKNNNFSIDNYTIGQPDVTEAIGKQLARLKFQGAGGWVEFDKHRGVSTPVDVVWAWNGTSNHVGIYDHFNSSQFQIDIDSSDLPQDRLPKQFARIDQAVVVVLYTLTIFIAILTTIQLILFICYRQHSIIKATSPWLSILMFIGCYLLCFAAIVNVTIFYFKTSLEYFSTLLHIGNIATFNGLSLILITLFIKHLRVYRIFSSKLKTDIGGKCWNGVPLFAAIIGLTLLPNVVIVILIATLTPVFEIYEVKIRRILIISEEHYKIRTTGYFITIGFILLYLSLFAILNIFLAISTRKIRYTNFKDTKKINLFIAIVFVTLALMEPVYIVLIIQGDEPNAIVTLTTSILFVAASCQVVLVLPKVLPTILSKHFTLKYASLSSLSTRINVGFTNSLFSSQRQ